jgi:hypothetical protein
MPGEGAGIDVEAGPHLVADHDRDGLAGVEVRHLVGHGRLSEDAERYGARGATHPWHGISSCPDERKHTGY